MLLRSTQQAALSIQPLALAFSIWPFGGGASLGDKKRIDREVCWSPCDRKRLGASRDRVPSTYVLG